LPDLLIRDLDAKLLDRLKQRAKRQGRSLQSEVKEILKNNAPLSIEEARARLAEITTRLGGRKFSDSADLLRADRDR
jgi:plasmid stability protein